MKQFWKPLTFAALAIVGLASMGANPFINRVSSAGYPVSATRLDQVVTDTFAYTTSAAEALGSELVMDRDDSLGTKVFRYVRVWGGVVWNKPGRLVYDSSAVNGAWNVTPLTPVLVDSARASAGYASYRKPVGVLIGSPTRGQYGWILVRGVTHVRFAAPASGQAITGGQAVFSGATSGLADIVTTGLKPTTTAANILGDMAAGSCGRVVKTATADTTLVLTYFGN